MKLTKSRILLSIFLLLLTSSLLAQEKVKAKSGDGIHRILQRHQMDTDEYYQKFIQLNKTKLIKGNQLVIGRKYTLPQKKKSKSANYYAIFGEKYGQINPIDNRLKGAIYYIVAGHGGPDPGAVGKRNGHIPY